MAKRRRIQKHLFAVFQYTSPIDLHRLCYFRLHWIEHFKREDGVHMMIVKFINRQEIRMLSQRMGFECKGIAVRGSNPCEDNEIFNTVRRMCGKPGYTRFAGIQVHEWVEQQRQEVRKKELEKQLVKHDMVLETVDESEQQYQWQVAREEYEQLESSNDDVCKLFLKDEIDF